MTKIRAMNKEEKEIYQYYETLAPNYNEDRFNNTYGKFIDKQERVLLQKYLQGKHKVLDLACGTGRFMDLAHEGADLSPAMLKEAQKAYPNKTFHCCSATQLPVADEYYDTVFSMHLLMHLSKDKFQEILDEVYRTLQPNGFFIFDVPSALRRKLIGYNKNGWHGNTAYHIEEIQDLIKEKWTFKAYQGIMILPIHHFPKSLRVRLSVLDGILSRNVLKSLASYYLVVLRK